MGSFLPSVLRNGERGHSSRRREEIEHLLNVLLNRPQPQNHAVVVLPSSQVNQTQHPWSIATITLSERTSLNQGSQDSLLAPSLLLLPPPSSLSCALLLLEESVHDSVLSPARLLVIGCPSELIPSGWLQPWLLRWAQMFLLSAFLASPSVCLIGISNLICPRQSSRPSRLIYDDTFLIAAISDSIYALDEVTAQSHPCFSFSPTQWRWLALLPLFILTLTSWTLSAPRPV